MKKVSFLVFALSVGLFANAQNFSIGPVAGTGNGWTNYKENEYGTLEKDPVATNFYGVQLLLKAMDHIYFIDQLLISKEGFTLNRPSEPNYTNFNMKYVRMNLQPVIH